jgi:hypothetical protein
MASFIRFCSSHDGGPGNFTCVSDVFKALFLRAKGGQAQCDLRSLVADYRPEGTDYQGFGRAPSQEGEGAGAMREAHGACSLRPFG